MLTENSVGQIASRQCAYLVDCDENVDTGAGQLDGTLGAHVEEGRKVELKYGLQTWSCIARNQEEWA